jgi:hypothetical protein
MTANDILDHAITLRDILWVFMIFIFMYGLGSLAGWLTTWWLTRIEK